MERMKRAYRVADDGNSHLGKKASKASKDEKCLVCGSQKDIVTIRLGSTYPVCPDHFDRIVAFVEGLK